jgi:heme exporter protein D
MFDLGPHASFIIAAYAVTFIAVGALAFTTIEDDHKQRRKIAELERQGIRRRSAESTKPTKAPAKRKSSSRRPKASS